MTDPAPPTPDELAALLTVLRTGPTAQPRRSRVITGEGTDALATWRHRREAALGLAPRPRPQP